MVQLSDNEGYCYSVVEALTVGTPVIVTNCPVFKEIGVNETNGFILDFELSKVPVKEIYKGLPKFKYKPKQDNWAEILAEGKSTYQEDRKSIVQVKCIKNYYDMELNRMVTTKDVPYEVTMERAEQLEENKVAKMTRG